MSRLRLILVSSIVIVLAACSLNPPEESAAAPGAPGLTATWSNAEKLAIGTSYEAYDATGQFSSDSSTAPISKVWFSVGQDRITEIIWGLIHEAQVREIQFLLVGPDGVLAPSEVRIERLEGERSTAPSPTLVYTYNDLDTALRVSIVTDPDRDSLLLTLNVTDMLPADHRVFAYIDPALANTGTDDQARIREGGLHAFEGEAHLFARSNTLSPQMSVGYVGVSDGLDDLSDGRLDNMYSSAIERGNVAGLMSVEFDAAYADRGRTGHLIIGFGETFEKAKSNADSTAGLPASSVQEKYAREWSDYLASLSELPVLAEVSGDEGALAYMSAINLKIMEDKTFAGALIASLSNPWGETAPADEPRTGYKAVWPRDFFQVASAFLAMGDAETARAAYRYLPMVQVRDDTPGNSGVTGWFLQKTHVDGEIEWVAIQQDQTAMPIMLGWQLWRAGVISDDEMANSYASMLKPAADFLVAGGRPSILWNTAFDASIGYTQQERWEEQEGYSPSTIAAVISGLVVAADLAGRFGDSADKQRYLDAADFLEANLEEWMFTTNGDLGDGEYFLRITRNQDPNDKASLGNNNGRPGLPEDQILDGGFLELVRYGVRSAIAPSILETIEELDAPHDDNVRVRYDFGGKILGWRRYGNDGYGEDGEAGTNYHEIEGGNTSGQRGRVWPFFSGERAHYEIEYLANAKTRYLDNHPEILRAEFSIRSLITSMEAFANEGLSLPEQVWDGVGPNPFGYSFGEGTNSATPLAWTHAEYIKLLRSVADEAVWDRYSIVEHRYADRAANQPAGN